MAEIRVPAWPMPIHQTKLRMAKPQPTGMSMPQMPTPFEEQDHGFEEEELEDGEGDPRIRDTSRGASCGCRTIWLICVGDGPEGRGPAR